MMVGRCYVALAVVIVSFFGLARCYKFGYPPESCTDLCPYVGCQNGTEHPEIKPSSGPSPYENSITYSSEKLFRKRPLQVNFTAPSENLKIKSAIFSFRDGEKPVGTFTSFDKSLQPLECKENFPKNSVLTNSDNSSKTTVSFTWMPPDIDKEQVSFSVGLVSEEDSFYRYANFRNFLYEYYPFGTTDCGKQSSCIKYGPSNCDFTDCTFVAKFKLENENRTALFILGGKAAKDNEYIALGFTEDTEKLNSTKIFACIRGEKSIKEYGISAPDGQPMPAERNFEDVHVDEDGDFLWCKFEIAAKIGEADLLAPYYQLYISGTYNQTLGTIVLPSKENYGTSKDKMKLGVPTDKKFTNSASSVTIISLTTLIALSLAVQSLVS